MRHPLRSALAGVMAMTLSAGWAAETVSRAYGVQIYSEAEPTARPKLVSFSIDNPSEVRMEQDFGAYNILAAACDGSTYYFLHSDDEFTPSRLVGYDMMHQEFHDIASYNANTLMGGLVVLDMTYDPTMECLYMMAADISKGEMVDGQLNAPFGLYMVDPSTGGTELVGLQEMTVIVSVAVGGGELWGVDEEGNLWIIDKYSGMLYDIMGSTGIEPIGTQSMAYDEDKNTYYWASYSADSKGNGVSNLISFHLTDDWDLQTEELGKIGGNAELIGLYIDSNPLDENSPAYARDFKVAPAAGGKAEATLTWTNPTLTIGGAKLEGTLTAVIARDEQPIAEVAGNPGEAMSWTDTETGSALYTYSVSIRSGELTGNPVYADPAFVGTDVPAAPAAIEAARTGDGYSIKVSWTAPSKGAEDGWFDASDLRYTVVRYPDGKVLAEATQALEYTDTDITAQAGYSYGIKAVSKDGVGPEGLSNIVVSGPAINPPYAMTLDEADTRLWTVCDGDRDGYEWYVHRTGWGGTWDPFFWYYPVETIAPDGEADDWIFSPYFAFEKGKNYLVTYDLRLWGDLFPGSSSLWLGQGVQPADMKEELLSEKLTQQTDMDWETRTVPFSVEEDGTYNFGFKMENRVMAQLYKFTVREVSDIDMEAVSVNGPATVSEGSVFSYDATVKNAGFQTVDRYTVRLEDNEGWLLAEKKVTDTPLAPGETAVVAVEWTPAAEGSIGIKAVVATDQDGVSSNDATSSITVRVLGKGTWIDITDGTGMTGFAPVYARALYSAAQTIYTADLINRPSGTALKAVTYYIGSFRGVPVDLDLELWAGNTDLSSFESDEPIAEEDMTKVFDGTVTVIPGEQTLTLAFDAPFEYSGQNLVLFTRHASEESASIAFKARYANGDPNHTLVAYSDLEPFDFNMPMMPQRDLPNVSILSEETTGVSAVTAEEGYVAYDRASRRILVDGAFKTVRVYDALGATLKAFAAGEELILPAALDGVGIVEVTTESGRTVGKIRF